MDRLAVVIPCYRCKNQILGVLQAIPPEVKKIYVVDDKCPQESGRHAHENFKDERLSIIYHPLNLGVGGAVISGYRAALKDKMDIVAKIDGDGQMDPRHLKRFVRPIRLGQADYTKGNRFFNIEDVRAMPLARLIGNAGLALLTKFSSGYWNLFDPTNGYTVIHATTLNELALDKVDPRFFFESDLLMRLHLSRAVVLDIPMRSHYGDENSNLSVLAAIPVFFFKHVRNAVKRVFYEYFLRNFSPASIELVFGLWLFGGGLSFGVYSWKTSAELHRLTSAGTVMLSVTPALIGFQLLLQFLNADIGSVPRRPRSLDED